MAENWRTQPLLLIIYGASGDLAKKKTFPAIFDLFQEDLLPKDTVVLAYARSQLANEDLFMRIKPYMRFKEGNGEEVFTEFCKLVSYAQGEYSSEEDLAKALATGTSRLSSSDHQNRLFYFALPPSVFTPAAESVRRTGISPNGFTRLVIEKPFGQDTKSATNMAKEIGALFKEESIYRIDHYLGKEIVQGLLSLRFTNIWLESLLNKKHVQSVLISFKENIGTNGRGGYFDKSGIIRDVMQNHLMQVLSLLAMEPPKQKGDLNKNIRDEKVKLLKSIKPWKLSNTVLGQYVGNDTEKGYLEDETVPEGSICPTFACVVMEIKNSRWSGVPFVMRAGKALNERKCEIRIQLKPIRGSTAPPNEIIMRIQPHEAVYIKTNIKTPGMSTALDSNHMDLSLSQKYPNINIPHAYSRLLLDVLKGRQQNFVRSDELLEAWKIVTPLLMEITKDGEKPHEYVFGTRGPEESDALMEKAGKWIFQNNVGDI